VRLVKGTVPMLGCDIYTLEQQACGRIWQFQLAVLPWEQDEEEYPRKYLAWRLRSARRALRDCIAHYQEEKASVHHPKVC
jgi:hypothetical protein